MKHLSSDIGIRLAGSENATKAAQYARQQFESWGYAVEMQEFSDARPEVRVYARVIVQQPQEHFLHSIVFAGSQPGSISGAVVDGGTGQDADFSDAAGQD